MAKALATEAGLNFIAVKGPEVMEKILLYSQVKLTYPRSSLANGWVIPKKLFVVFSVKRVRPRLQLFSL
jgi:hypothetical protein